MSQRVETVKTFWKRMSLQEWDQLEKMFPAEARIFWPNTAETFTPETYINVNRNYPGQWRLDLEKLEETNDSIITVTRIKALNEAVSLRAISFFRFQGEAIISLTEFFADDTIMPEWRQKG